MSLYTRRKSAAKLDAAWWAAHLATCAEVASGGRKVLDAPVAAQQADLSPKGPTVQAGYMETDLTRRIMYPIYWPGEPRALLRATWYVEVAPGKGWAPLPHPIASTLESRWQQRCASPCCRARSHVLSGCVHSLQRAAFVG